MWAFCAFPIGVTCLGTGKLTVAAHKSPLCTRCSFASFACETDVFLPSQPKLCDPTNRSIGIRTHVKGAWLSEHNLGRAGMQCRHRGFPNAKCRRFPRRCFCTTNCWQWHSYTAFNVHISVTNDSEIIFVHNKICIDTQNIKVIKYTILFFNTTKYINNMSTCGCFFFLYGI